MCSSSLTNLVLEAARPVEETRVAVGEGMGEAVGEATVSSEDEDEMEDKDG